MNLKEVKENIEQIENSLPDYEAAHAYEDALYEKFIDFAAKEGTGKIKTIAKEIQKTRKIDFPRYCA